MASNVFTPRNPASQPPPPTASASSLAPPPSSTTDPKQPRAQPRKRKGHRGGKNKRSRRKSFAALADDSNDEMHQPSGDAFYQMPQGNLSGASIDSEALLDHR